jgi:spore coat protein CotH
MKKDMVNRMIIALLAAGMVLAGCPNPVEAPGPDNPPPVTAPVTDTPVQTPTVTEPVQTPKQDNPPPAAKPEDDNPPGEPEKQLSGIEIAAPPDKTAYLMGEIIDLGGLRVNAVYDDGSREETEDYNALLADTFTAGPASIVISAKNNGDLTASFEINVSGELMDTGLPVVYIETQDAQPVLSKENYVNMNLRITSDNPAYRLEKTGFQDGIRGRGNSTWNYPKKPYRIKFNSKTSLFGLERAKSWVLLANYKDSTLLSNTVAFELGQRFGLPYTNHYVHVEVVLNGVYQGSYVLTEQVQVGNGRVAIDEDEGYLVELDVYYDEEPKFRTTSLNLPVMIKSPEDLDDDSGYDFVRDSLNALDAALSDEDFPDTGYTDLLDIDNFVDFLMINEIVRNTELGHPKSTYLYKDAGEKIKMGPLWDFDWAFGLGGNKSITLSTAESRMTGGWFFERFFDDPEFVSKYRARWNEKYGDIAGISPFIDDMYNRLERSQSLNSRRWYAVDYEAEIGRLKTWWNRRVAWLNTAVNAE